MKRTKAELKQYIADNITDNDDLVISLLEDIEDSMSDETAEQVIDETNKKALEDLQWKYDDLKAKYKARFLDSVEEVIQDETGETEELQEQEVIDIKEI